VPEGGREGGGAVQQSAPRAARKWAVGVGRSPAAELAAAASAEVVWTSEEARGGGVGGGGGGGGGAAAASAAAASAPAVGSEPADTQP